MQLSLVPEPNASQSLSLLICKMRTPAHFLKSPPALNKFSFCQGDTRKKLSYIFKQKFLERRGVKKKQNTFSWCRHWKDPSSEISGCLFQKDGANLAIPGRATCGWALRVWAPPDNEGQGRRPEKQAPLSQPLVPYTGWGQTSPRMEREGLVGDKRERERGQQFRGKRSRGTNHYV